MKLTHVDASGLPTMVDVSGKAVTDRTAHARAEVVLPVEVMALFRDGEAQTKKGPVIQTAIIAGTMAVKRTADLIPFCHPLPVEGCRIIIMQDGPDRLAIDCHVSVRHKTGVEMEALTGASVAALTVYDMLKALSHDICVTNLQLMEKSGGRRDFRREQKEESGDA